MVKDLTQGSVVRQLFLFAPPLFVANVLQAVYNIVDMIVVGQIIGGMLARVGLAYFLGFGLGLGSLTAPSAVSPRRSAHSRAATSS